jgi:hypothetical protein
MTNSPRRYVHRRLAAGRLGRNVGRLLDAPERRAAHRTEPVYWDNGGHGSGAENFGLIDRASHDVLHPPLLQAMLAAANGTQELTDIAPPS